MAKRVNAGTPVEAFQRALESMPFMMVDFSAEWCGPCKQIAPHVDELSEQNPDLIFLQVDVDECPELTKAFRITAMPTFILFSGKSEVGRIMGADLAKLKGLVQRAASPAAPAQP
eukprot:RCo008447